MQAELKTIPAAAAFIPLTTGTHTHLTAPYIRPNFNQQKYQNANSYYNRTKRKRDSSSGSNSHTPLRGGSPGGVINLPPWVPPDNPYSKDYIIALHEEINDFFQWITPTQEEHYMRLGVVGRIEACVKKIWPSAALHIFGSFRTGLYLPTSDIDLALFGKWDHLPLRTLEKALLDDDIADPATLKVLDKASVPIIKMMDKRTRVRVDVSFNMVNGIKSVELVKMYKKKYPPLPKLIYVLKQFLLQRDLNEVFTGGLSSYCLILMVVSFLQLHARHDVGEDDANLGVLLLEFFELYGKSFDYQSLAIRVTGSGSYVPKEEIQEEMPAGVRPSLLCVEDPLQPGNDVGKSSYGALRVRQAFDYAYGVLDRAMHGVIDTPSLLSTIIQVEPSTIQYRDWIRQNFSIPPEVKDGSVSPIPEPDIPEHDETDEEEEEDDDEVPDNHAHHAKAALLHHHSQQNSNSNHRHHHASPAHSNNYTNHQRGGGKVASAAMDKYREESDSGDSGEGGLLLLKDEQESNSDSEAEREEVEERDVLNGEANDDDDDIIVLGDDESSDGGSEADDSSPERPCSSPEVIDLTRDDDCETKSPAALRLKSGAAKDSKRKPMLISNRQPISSQKSGQQQQAMSISPVTSESGENGENADSPARKRGGSSASNRERRRGSKNSNISAANSTETVANANAAQSNNGGNSNGTPTPSKTNATRASKPLYKPPVNRYSTWTNSNNKNKNNAMTRADLDMNWRASARGPGSDQSSNSGGEMQTLPPQSSRKEKAEPTWRGEFAKPPNGSQKSRKSQDGKRKEDNKMVNVASSKVNSQEKRVPESSKKIAETAGKNRKDTHRNQRSSKSMGGEPSSSGVGASKVSTPSSASAVKSMSKQHSSAAVGSKEVLCDSSSSSSSGIGSSRLSSSGGSSDAVDNCDNGQTSSTAVVSNEARRVPELHPEGGCDDVASNGGSRKSSIGGGVKEPLSRQASSNGGDDNSSPSMVAKSLSKKKRKKRLDKNSAVAANGQAVSSRDCSPTTAVNSSSSRQPAADKRVITNPPHSGSSSSGSNKNNASNRFSCEAGPRIPKR